MRSRLSQEERDASFFHADLGAGEVFCVNGRLVLREHCPVCEMTGIPTVVCRCPEHGDGLWQDTAAA